MAQRHPRPDGDGAGGGRPAVVVGRQCRLPAGAALHAGAARSRADAGSRPVDRRGSRISRGLRGPGAGAGDPGPAARQPADPAGAHSARQRSRARALRREQRRLRTHAGQPGAGSELFPRRQAGLFRTAAQRRRPAGHGHEPGGAAASDARRAGRVCGLPGGRGHRGHGRRDGRLAAGDREADLGAGGGGRSRARRRRLRATGARDGGRRSGPPRPGLQRDDGHHPRPRTGAAAPPGKAREDGAAAHRRAPGGPRFRGGGQRGQEPVPGQHEPRDPHPDERHHRPVQPGPARPAAAARARLRAEGAGRRPLAAGHHQRHPRLLEDRGRQARHRVGWSSTCATRCPAWPT